MFALESICQILTVSLLPVSNPKSFWRQIKLSKQSTTKLYTFNGKTKINEISSDFREHFNKLLNTPRIPNWNNEDSRRELLTLFDELSKSIEEDFYVTELDVSKAINKLNANKSRDPFQLQAEHLLHSPREEYLSCITRLNDLLKEKKNTRIP